MRYVSTRGGGQPVSLSEAIRNGAAPDGGLYLPETLPQVDPADFAADLPLARFAVKLIAPFFSGDAMEKELEAICEGAFGFPVPLVRPYADDRGLRVLELFHGPTGAFKDFGALFLMGCFDRIGRPGHPLTVLVATSGDTGGAVGSAAEGREGVRALILYPKGRVSPFQELQLTCWKEPVRALEVDGDFDDCQRLVKSAFADPDLVRKHSLTSANSINIGRLLPQMVYWAASALALYRETGVKPGLIIPTGNLGHGFAAAYCRAMGMPIGPIIIATNANRTLHDWQRDGVYKPQPSVATVANAMDVGAPSNFERLIHLPEDLRALRVELVEDSAILARVRADARAGYLWCPHSATAAEAYSRLAPEQRSERVWVAGATAHPFKFADVLGSEIGEKIDAPPALRRIMGRPSRKISIAADLGALVRILDSQSDLIHA